LFHMLGQGANLRHHMEEQALDQFPRTDSGRTATPHATTAQQGVKEPTGDQLGEQSPEGSRWNDSKVSHPQLNGVLDKKYKYKPLIIRHLYTYTSSGVYANP
jgi:hypothetical protein